MTIEIEPHLPEEPQPQKQPGCLFRLITGFVILTLLASSMVSIAWFVRQGQDRQQKYSAVTPTNPLPTQKEELPALSTAAPLQSDPPASIRDGGNDLPPQNRILLVNNDGQIETVNPDGNERRILTGAEYNFQNPAWSPDGTKIAALGSNNEGSGIFLLEDNEEPSVVNELFFGTELNPFYLYWSPDGNKISYLASQFGRQMSLNIVGAQAGEENQTIATGSPFFWNWTADSEQLLIHSGALPDDARLALIDNGGNDQIPKISDPGFFQAPGISPSGRFWAYSQLQNDGNSWLTIDNRQTGNLQTERHAGSLALSWSPTADKLAFISGEDDSQSSFWGPLRLIDAETGAMRVLSSNLVLAFFWSPDGQKIVTISVPYNAAFEGDVEVRNTKLRHFAKNNMGTVKPVQSNAHTFSIAVINVEDGSGLELSEVNLPTGFLTQFLVFFDQYALSHTIWSPQSDAIVLPIVANNESQLTVIKTDSGRMHSIGAGRIAFWSPH